MVAMVGTLNYNVSRAEYYEWKWFVITVMLYYRTCLLLLLLLLVYLAYLWTNVKTRKLQANPLREHGDRRRADYT